MTDFFNGRTPSLSGPATDIVPVQPDDQTDLAQGAVALYVETGGSLRLTTVRGHATGTSATGIHALVV